MSPYRSKVLQNRGIWGCQAPSPIFCGLFCIQWRCNLSSITWQAPCVIGNIGNVILLMMIKITILFLLLAYLTWKLNWAVLISCFLSCVCLSVNFSHFHLLQKHWGNVYETWHKSIHGCTGFRLLQINEGLRPIPTGHSIEIANNQWRNSKIFSRTTGPISRNLVQSIEEWMGFMFFKWRVMPFSKGK